MVQRGEGFCALAPGGDLGYGSSMQKTERAGPRGLVIGGTRSGCGKTSVALGLMRALSRRGLAVQAMKAGPDFIDPGHHALATGRPGHNLDDWMCGAKGMRAVFERYAAGADVVVVEGVMGLFDGFSATDEAGSTARLAKLLGLPVLLVADAASMARSAAALVGGYLAFDPDLPFCGVVLNNAGSESHAALLREALAAALPATRLWGVLPRRPELATPSRHLGLLTAEDDIDALTRLDRLADWLEAALDLPALLDTLPPFPPVGGSGGDDPPRRVQGGALAGSGAAPQPPEASYSPRIGVARDRAFCFYYAENLRLLEAAGAGLVPFSPLAEGSLPEGLDGLYLGGGYPELHAGRLAENAAMRRAVRDFCLSGRPVLAECGGFMYLMESVADGEGREHPMAGVFPLRAAMGERFAALGYREVTTREATLLGPAGTVVRGHEFHYSRLVGGSGAVPAVYAMTGRKGVIDVAEGFLAGRTLGSYVHLHFGSNPEAARQFVAACRERAGEEA
ncbi:Cobyrinic acid A,C-diamide synthase [Solidesulfovibrio carbinoliphilus subsp. oakridgensis]|uniref:Cobyrinate a,c-diamide synthase n=2 Tax=Solidesulfovibrio carbinoliphilus TaxID=345370 RepID=G7Q8Q1_9BACT|nr:Cobyrinic acid A,C-diamide synthase [Solidesulfovibrio carbinoliphilus subsp. oakridgensis]